MRRFLCEYVKAVLVVASVFGGAALALEVPEIDTGARWVMREVFHVMGEYRGAAITAIVLGLAAALTTSNEIERRQTRNAGPNR